MDRSLGVVVATAFAGALAACAALSGLTAYTSDDCSPGGCDGSAEAIRPTEDGRGPGADAAMITDASAEPDHQASADGHGSCGSGLVACDGGCVASTTASNCGRCGNTCGGAAPMCAAVSGAYSCVAAGGGSDGSADATGAGSDAGSDAGLDAGLDGNDAGSDAGVDANDAGDDLSVGLIAFYKFDETSGTTAADSSGNNKTASLVGGATFSPGLQNNAVAMSGRNQYVSLPSGIVSGLMSFSICAWVNLSAGTTWSRIFDFGTGTTAYMFLTPNSSAGTLRFSITTGGSMQEQQMNAASALTTGSWQHVAVTLTANTGTLYVDGAQVAQNTGMTLNPASLGATTQNWLGRSQYAGDPYLNGQIDNFRIYDRALTVAEVQALFTGHL